MSKNNKNDTQNAKHLQNKCLKQIMKFLGHENNQQWINKKNVKLMEESMKRWLYIWHILRRGKIATGG